MNSLIDAFVAGSICGFLASIPVGPINITVVNRAMRKGFWPAFFVGLGAIVGESFYAALALTGHSWLPTHRVAVVLTRIVAVVVMAALGIHSLLVKPDAFEASAAQVEKVDERWHHPRSFLLGFALALFNLFLIAVWATVTALVVAHEWVQPVAVSRALCLAGVLFGGVVWYFLLSFGVSRTHHRIDARILTRLVRACGVVLLVFAALLAARLNAP